MKIKWKNKKITIMWIKFKTPSGFVLVSCSRGKDFEDLLRI